jgi:heat shock protein HtpX
MILARPRPGLTQINVLGAVAHDSDSHEPAHTASAAGERSMRDGAKVGAEGGERRAGYAPGDAARRRSLSALLEAVVVLAIMGALLGFCGFVLAGVAGVLWAAASGAGLLLAVRAVRLHGLLRMLRATPLPAAEHAEVAGTLRELADRAGIRHAPRLYMVDSPAPIAFTVADRKGAALVVSASLLEQLTRREIAGIFAHELVHLRHSDIRLMQFAGVLRQATAMLTRVGMVLLLASLLARVLHWGELPLLPLLVLTLAPFAAGLLQLALARSREAAADLEAVELTGDPEGLISALSVMTRLQETEMRRMFPGARLLRLPAFLQDHPATSSRISRLSTLARQRRA